MRKILVRVNCGSEAEARAIAAAVVERRLVACATVEPPVRSVYVWKGRIERSREIPLTMKTSAARWRELEAEIRRLHSYEVPEILALPVLAGSRAYLRWIDAVLAEKPAARRQPASRRGMSRARRQ